MSADQTEGLWVNTDPMPDGSYHIVLSLDGDRAWPLTRSKARMHALAALNIAEEASYEQALFGQMTSQLGVDRDAALGLLSNFRQWATRIDHAATAPLQYVGGINPHGVAFITLLCEDKPVGQISPNALRRHALALLQVRVISHLDELYRRLLIDPVGVDDQRAMAAVTDLARHRPDDGYRAQA